MYHASTILITVLERMSSIGDVMEADHQVLIRSPTSPTSPASPIISILKIADYDQEYSVVSTNVIPLTSALETEEPHEMWPSLNRMHPVNRLTK